MILRSICQSGCVLAAIVACLVILPFCNVQAVVVVGELTREYQMYAGDRVEGVLLLRNTSDSTRFVRVYKTDYFFSIDKTVYGEPGQLPRSNADWISFRPASVTLQPQEEAVIHYRIEMPVESDEFKLSGTYWSVIMVEGIDEEDLALEDMSHSGTGVGIRLSTPFHKYDDVLSLGI